MDVYSSFAEFYDVYVGDWLEDLPFYIECAKRSGGAILEVGAGSGRLTIPLARDGFDVTAVDVSASMLRILRSRLAEEPPEVAGRVTLLEADVCELGLDAEYELVMVPFYTFNYLLTTDAQRAALQRIQTHLAPSARAIIDVFVPHDRIANCPKGAVLCVDTTDLRTGCRVRGWNVYCMDLEKQVEVRNHIFEVTEPGGTITKKQFVTRRRYFFKNEIESRFLDNGLTVDAVYEDYQQAPATEQSAHLVYVLRQA